MSTFDSSVSGYLTSDFEGISMTFTEVTPLPSSGYCKIYKAQRYGPIVRLKAGAFFAHRLREYPARPSSFFVAKPNWTNLDQAAFFEKH